MKRKKLIGIVGGGGTGPELIKVAKRILDKVAPDFEYTLFDNDKWYSIASTRDAYSKSFLEELTRFYSGVQKKEGIVIRGALPATTLYKLREKIGQTTKFTPIYPLSELSDLTSFSKDELAKTDILLAREILHGEYHSETYEKDGKVYQIIEHDPRSLDTFAKMCFEVAHKRAVQKSTQGYLHLMIKDKTLGSVGKIWRDAFYKASKDYSDVRLGHFYPGVCEIMDNISFLKQEEGPIDVIACPDNVGDTLMDDASTVLHGSSCLTPSGNFSSDGFASYQTIHGAITTKTGKDEVNPIGMVHAVAMALDYSYGMLSESQAIKNAVRMVLGEGYRTRDIYRKNSGKTLVGTEELSGRIIQNL